MHVSLADSSDEESDWSVEEQAEAGELDFLQQKAKEAILSKFKFVLDKISSKMKAMENSVKKTYNALNAYSWDPFDPVQHCQGE